MKVSREHPEQAPRRTTLLELVQSFTRQETPDAEVVATVLELVESGRVILTGNFRGLPLRDPGTEPV
jgi:hypothetical protein